MSSTLKCKMAKLTKLKDEKFFGKHPNGIDEGFIVEVDIKPEIPLMGFSYRFGRLSTSEVTEIVEITDINCVFRTKNSTYKVEFK